MLKSKNFKKSKSKIFFDIIKRLNRIQKIEHLSDKEIALLSVPKRISYSQLKIKDKKLSAWRILFNDALGPGKGGVRFHPNVSEDEVKSLSFWMMIKNSLAGLPYGGAKGGIKFNPKKTSVKETEIISRKFIDSFYKVLGQDKDIPAPDVYTNSQIMAWMLDEYEKRVGHHEPGMITGKPLELQGCDLRADATAKGGFIIAQEMIKEYKLNKKNIRIAIQGFGNAGSNIARFFSKDGYRVVAISDSSGGIYNSKGLNIKKVIDVKRKTGSLTASSGTQKITNEKLLKLPVDVLVLAALENQITKDNVDEVRAKYILEIANGPISYDADRRLFSKNITIIPDVLANAGGVIVSYFEWTQNRTGNILDKKYLENLLKEKMVSSWRKVIKLYKQRNNKIDIRTVAYIIAIQKILSAEKLRGNL